MRFGCSGHEFVEWRDREVEEVLLRITLLFAGVYRLDRLGRFGSFLALFNLKI